MAKLGIIINTTFEGKSEAYSANSSEWSNEVRDIRTLLEQVQGVAKNEIPLLLTYAKDGVFLVLIKSIYGRGGDNISAWIHIPSNINIAGKEVEEIVNHVSKSISGTTLETASLDELFSREYETEIAKHIVDVPTYEKIAIREYKGDTIFQIELSTLLDSKYLFQPVYSQYKYVFLVDNKKSRLSCPTGTKLKDANVVESVIVRPVEDKDGFSLFYKDEKFITAFFAYKAEKLTFVWKKPGYKDVPVEYEVREGGTVPSLHRKDYRKYVPYTNIIVRDKKTMKKVNDYRLTVLGASLTDGHQFPISEDSLGSVAIVVKADGYNTFEKEVDLSSPKIVELEPATFKYKFSLSLTTGDSYIMEVESLGRLNHAPIEGYHNVNNKMPSEHDVNYIKYNPFDKKFKRRQWIIRSIFLGLGIIIGGVIIPLFQGKNDEKPNVSSPATHTTEIKEGKSTVESPKKNNLDFIIEYMDIQPKWIKTDLDMNPQIFGLWDALNKYDFERIKQFKEPLKKSKKFTELITAIENDSKARSDYGETFNRDLSDLEITIDNYIKKIKTQKSQKPVTPTMATDNKENSFGRK